MEAVSTLLALVVGLLALVLYYNRKDTAILFVGVGFLGAAFLDGYHAIVTATYFSPFMPSGSQSLIPWSWVASRLYLSILMVLSYQYSRTSMQTRQVSHPINEKKVYFYAATFTLLCFLFFAFVQLPQAYYAETFFHRPAEFAPAVLFLWALIGYLKAGRWKRDLYEHWLIMSLLIAFVSQAVFMTHSGTLFDFEFDVAHMLKNAGYICVLIGLLINMYFVFRSVEATTRELSSSVQKLADSEGRVRAIIENIVDGIITIDDRGIIQSINPAASHIFQYPTDQMIGKNVKFLAAEPHRAAHDNYLRNYRATGDSSIIGVGREVEGLRRDGTTFPMQLEIAEIQFQSERLFLGVVRDVSKQKEVDRLKAEFVSTVSHELRTPLTSIRGSLGMIESGSLTDPDQLSTMVGLASKNTERLINLVNDLLDMEKLQANKMELIMVDIDVRELVENSIELNKPYADEFDVGLRLASGSGDAIVVGDADRLTQVMSNLLSNAAKFSQKDSVVEIRIDHQGEFVRVGVQDQGSGIPVEFHEHIFERFSQGDSSDSRKKGGTGLGLSISRAIIVKHGGTIDFESEAGQGSTFHFDLPVKIKKSETVNLSAVIELDDLPSKDSRILVLEDDPDIADLLAMMLMTAGYKTDVAHNVVEAKEFIANSTYSAMTVDVMLPDSDGIGFVRELRTNEATKDIATIVVSAKANMTKREVVTSSMGIVDWLEKPVDRNSLVGAVERAVSNRPGDKAPRILHVEDDQDLAEVMAAMIGDNMLFEIADTVKEAQLGIISRRYDLIILDPGMPDGNGLDLLESILNSRNKSTPIIIYSSDEIDRNAAARVDRALLKSKNSNEELLSIIKNLI
jgi:PAS domain S-box-containing protein